MFNHRFDSWQAQPPPATHLVCSPNLQAVLRELQRRWPHLTSLGCFGQRPVRGGQLASSHSFGAAIDVGFPPEMDQLVADQVVPFLVGRSLELHVQAIHDYRRSRIWRAGRTDLEVDACGAWWRAQRGSRVTGMGQTWCNHLHVETTADGWGDSAPAHLRWVE